jgi:SET domain-containing protein
MLLVETYLAESPNKGLGIFSKNFIPKDTIIWKFVEGFDIKVHEDEYKSLSDIQKQFVDKYFWKEGNYLYSSCDHSVFQNHSFNPNSVEDGEDMKASRDILPGEEILVDYGTFDDDFNIYKNNLI